METTHCPHFIDMESYIEREREVEKSLIKNFFWRNFIFTLINLESLEKNSSIF